MPFVVPVLAAIGGGSATVGAVTAVGTAVSVAGGLSQASAQRRAGRAQRENAMTEAAMTEAATQQADKEAREEIARLRREHRTFRGTQRARVAGSGVVGTTGSPLDILGRTAALQELQIQDTARRADTEERAGMARARQLRVAGRSAATGARRAATGTVLGTASRTALGVANARDQGLWGGTRSLMPA